MNMMCDILGVDTSGSPWDCAMFLLLLKIDRWCNLRREGKDPANESIQDTLVDAHNYLDLAYACMVEEANLGG